jgi:hypothetical protein
MARLNSTDLVLQLRDALPVAAVQFIATSLSAVPGCAVSTIPYKESGTYLRVAVQLSSVTGKQGTPPYSAAAVLQATAWVEDNAQVRRAICALAVLMPHDNRVINTHVVL